MKGFSINGPILKVCAELFLKIPFNASSDEQNKLKETKTILWILNTHKISQV